MKTTDKALITVVTVNYNTSDFVEVSLQALARLTRNSYQVIICDNGSSWLDKRKLRQLASSYKNVSLLFRKQTAYGSMGHGEALNILVDQIDAQYGVIIDADATFLKRDWDEILINQLDDRVKIIGATIPPNTIRPSDFPLIYAVLFDTQVFKSLKIDMRPRDPQIGQDVGWEMRDKFLEAGYGAKVLEAKNTRVYKEGPFGSLLCEEHYLEGYDDIFVSHFGRGAGGGVPKYKELSKLLRLPGINKVAARVKGNQEKRRWLHICCEIIEEQAKQ
jgi:glycosyltransferase involved in cell wall biosynthesis